MMGCGCRELMHWWNVAQEPSGSPPFRLFHHPISPPSSSSLSLHLCLYCPLSNLIIHALYPPLSLSLSFCLSFSALPSCLHPQLAAVARHQGQISTPFPASLSSSVFLFLPPLTLHFLCSDAILKFLSLPV